MSGPNRDTRQIELPTSPSEPNRAIQVGDIGNGDIVLAIHEEGRPSIIVRCYHPTVGGGQNPNVYEALQQLYRAIGEDKEEEETDSVQGECYPVLRWPGEPNRPTQPGLHFLRDTESSDPEDVFVAEVADPPIKDDEVFFYLLGHSELRSIELPSKFEWVYAPDPIERLR